MSYICFQVERCPDTDRAHVQGYMELKKYERMTWLQREISRTAHWEIRRGTQQQAIEYCKKEDTREEGPWEWGKPAPGQGYRSDLVSYKKAIFKGKRKRELAESHLTTMARFPKLYKELFGMVKRKRRMDLLVKLYIGETGRGKTRSVYDRYEDDDFWCMPNDNKAMWFDTYDGHKVVLLDDFAGRSSPIVTGKQLY